MPQPTPSRRACAALCVMSAGFAEVGAEGRARQQALVALVRSHGGRLIGPNCLGIAAAGAAPQRDVRRPAAPAGWRRLRVAERRARPGRRRAGARARARPLRLRLARQQGRRLVQRPARVLGGRRRDVGRRAVSRELRQPAALRAHRSPRRASQARAGAQGRRDRGRRASSCIAHGGARELGGRRRRALPAIRRAARADALGVPRRRRRCSPRSRCPRGPRVAVLTNAGGLAILCADACAAEGLELPPPSDETRAALRAVLPAEASLENPIDVLGSATRRDVRHGAARCCSPIPAFDAVCVLFVRPIVTTAADVVREVDAAIAGAGHEKPVVGVFLSAERGFDTARPEHVARFESPEAAARALGVAARRAAWLRRPEGVDARARRHRSRRRPAPSPPRRSQTSDEVWLDAVQGRRLLEAYGIRAGARGDCRDPASSQCGLRLPWACPWSSSPPPPARTSPTPAAWHSICATRSPFAPRPPGSAARCWCSRCCKAPSCSPASPTIPSSARSSRSASAEFRRSSSKPSPSASSR